jgi:hypothetical protein
MVKELSTVNITTIVFIYSFGPFELVF